MKTFELPITLRVVGRGHDVGGFDLCDEAFEVVCTELGTLVRDDARTGVRVEFFGFLQDDFGVTFFHFDAEVPVQNGPGEAVQDANEVEEDSADFEVGEVDVPVLVR